MIPVVIAILAGGTALYKLFSDDDKPKDSSTTNPKYSSEYEALIKRQSSDKKKEEIKNYRSKEKNRLKNKHEVDISYIDGKKIVIKTNPNESAMLSRIDLLEMETNELIQLIAELEVMKHA